MTHKVFGTAMLSPEGDIWAVGLSKSLNEAQETVKTLNETRTETSRFTATVVRIVPLDSEEEE